MLEREQMLCFSLGAAMRRISRIYAEALAAHDITPPQLFLLSCLGRSDGLKPSELAEQVCLDTSSLTGLLDQERHALHASSRCTPRTWPLDWPAVGAVKAPADVSNRTCG